MFISQSIFDTWNPIKEDYPPMQTPSAKEVADLLIKTRKESWDILPSDRKYDEFQHRLQAIRKKIDGLIRKISTQLHFAFQHNAPSNQRKLMKHYGFNTKLNND